MKLNSISSNELLSKCRYCDGTDGNYILKQYGSLDFNIFENWQELSRLWGYTQLPERLVDLTAYTANRTCSKRLALKILEQLKYPNLQCTALLGIKDNNVFINLIEEWNKESEKNMSILWSLLEIWSWKLLNSNKQNVPINELQKNVVSDCIINLYNTVLNSGHAKAFIRWLFSKEYRGWQNVGSLKDVEKDIYILMEAIVVPNWKEELFDEDFNNWDYLSFLAIDVDNTYQLNDRLCLKILNSYFEILDEQKLSCIKLPISDNTFVWLEGFAEMFIRCKKTTLQEEIQNVLNKYQSIFGGWMVKGKMHDYRNIQSETFILCSLLLMCKYKIHDIETKKTVFRIISNRLLLQIHNCPNIYLEYYSVPAYLARHTANTISTDLLAEYDKTLILQHQDMEQIANIMNYSTQIKMQQSNKDLYRQRWDIEKNAWERRLHTTGQQKKYNMLQKIMQEICS